MKHAFTAQAFSRAPWQRTSETYEGLLLKARLLIKCASLKPTKERKVESACPKLAQCRRGDGLPWEGKGEGGMIARQLVTAGSRYICGEEEPRGQAVNVSSG